MNTALLLVLIAAALIAIVAFTIIAIATNRRIASVRRAFGPEYDRMIDQGGGRRRAAAELRQRAKRVHNLDLKPVTEAERERYLPVWQEIQAHFVDDPRAAVGGADQLIGKVLSDHGYQADNFDQLTADLSVNHPYAVQDFRSAHEIVEREADTEDLRRAMLGYRAVFEELVNEPVAAGVATPPPAPPMSNTTALA